MKVLCLTALALLAQLSHAALPDMQAIVHYETVSQGADGVEKTLRYSERWIRQSGHVWRERLNAAAPHRHDDDGHQHLDFAAAPRHVWRDAKGELQVEFLHAAKQERIAVAKREWSDAGFDGSWARASQLVDASQLRGFSKKRKSADVAVYRKAGKTLRWSERWQAPLRVSLRSDDGKQRETITVAPQALPAGFVPPWQRSAGWPERDYLDTLD
ncbi:hypothetical protein [Chromobacterium alticapitis]|uniref:DUF3108 domain-containing protein n=1 Tax=Chromobacterium alticapitis TaxID=2073169 RepID=A0A2S5DHX9_9NEIS|nr:hypothetical protein [Chromobacterium alticapitis]POZ62621.1 hypothetical protein C2I19_07590 [Chromobacterium alticapitis]